MENESGLPQQEPLQTCEANSSSASQDTAHVLWNLKVCYRVCKSPPPASIMNQINPVHTTL